MTTCDCYIVKRNGEPLTTADYDKDSPNAPSRILLCSLHDAAPELLAALDDAVFQLERFTQIHGDRAARPCLDRAQAAIAKAKGEKP